MKRNMHGLLTVALTLVLGVGCGEVPISDTGEAEPIGENEEALTDCVVDAAKELFITDLSVIQDARATGLGKWSFGYVVQEMAKGHDQQEFIKGFMETWLTDQVVDGLTIKARARMEELVLAPWRAKSADGKTYDLAKAPMSLLAIVYRLDLRKKLNVGEGVGEGRMVFNVHGPDGRALPFTMIFEYKLPANRGQTPESWAREFHALGALPFGPEYNAKLEVLTEKFVSAKSWQGMQPGSVLNQLRTNEIALTFGDATPLWELRQFQINSKGRLLPASVGLTPDLVHDNTPLLADFVRQNERKILDGTHKVGSRFKGEPFNGGSSRVPTNTFTWQVPGVAENLRKAFSIATCNGCHAGETSTNFLHVGKSRNGPETRISNFILETEFPRRVADMKSLACE
ncbi:hypothetical protein [Polyangium sp. 15x6]|uniref:hypothetical protein n=1 Tax=Polyangium sp. 15x6 TaxID=3042687 RepID=UPI00249B8B44|nr:hypothetical protein [Polyangium sp. 15x6]MDI3291764.1 hypothetical protein [Polyangium sp. 15x6]